MKIKNVKELLKRLGFVTEEGISEKNVCKFYYKTNENLQLFVVCCDNTIY